MTETQAAAVALAGMVATLALLLGAGRPLLRRRRVARRAQRYLVEASAAGAVASTEEASRPPSVRAARLGAVPPVYRTLVPLAGIAALAAVAAVALSWRPGLLVAIGAVGALLWQLQHQKARRDELEEQLPPVLVLLAAALGSGYSVQQALQRAVADSPEPIARELVLVEQAIALGASLDAAFSDLAARVGGENFEFFATIVTVQHRIGGDLPDLLTSLAASIQERIQLNAEIRALTAQARYSGLVLTAMPFAVLGLLLLASPDYVTPMFDQTAGRLMLLGGGVLLALGMLTIRFLNRIEL